MPAPSSAASHAASICAHADDAGRPHADRQQHAEFRALEHRHHETVEEMLNVTSIAISDSITRCCARLRLRHRLRTSGINRCHGNTTLPIPRVGCDRGLDGRHHRRPARSRRPRAAAMCTWSPETEFIPGTPPVEPPPRGQFRQPDWTIP
jgi:hypothetical protein